MQIRSSHRKITSSLRKVVHESTLFVQAAESLVDETTGTTVQQMPFEFSAMVWTPPEQSDRSSPGAFPMCVLADAFTYILGIFVSPRQHCPTKGMTVQCPPFSSEESAVGSKKGLYFQNLQTKLTSSICSVCQSYACN